MTVEGSLPVQYVETRRSGTRQESWIAEPYLAVRASHWIEPDLRTSVFANGGHDPLGSFRDSANTVASFGANLVKSWGSLSTGVSVEHSYYYDGVFGPPNMIANDVNIFARYEFRPNRDLRITPELVGTVRADDGFDVSRYTYSFRTEVEQRLIGSWWWVVKPRIRYAAYVGDESGRHDLTLSIVSGLRYQFTENVSFLAVAGYETRDSNIAGKSFDKLVGGVGLDFKFNPKLPW